VALTIVSKRRERGERRKESGRLFCNLCGGKITRADVPTTWRSDEHHTSHSARRKWRKKRRKGGEKRIVQ